MIKTLAKSNILPVIRKITIPVNILIKKQNSNISLIIFYISDYNYKEDRSWR